MKKFSIIISSCAISATAVSIAPSAMAAPKSHIIQIRKIFSYYLKDPSSLQIEIRVNKADAVCGRYNAKNSYGGYVGYKFFSFTPSTGTLYLVGTIVRASGQIQDSVAMAENLPLDPAEFDRGAAEARAVFDVASGKIRDCGNA